VVQDFYAAYDRRDLAAMFALLPKDPRYSDCDFIHHRTVFPYSEPLLRRWLRARFAEHDRFQVVGPFSVDPGPGKVGVVADVIRRSDSLDALVASGLMPSDDNGLGKFVVRANNKLDLVDLDSYARCTAGRLPHGSKPARERALARSFLDAYGRHDVAGVVALLAADIVYADCDVSNGTLASLSGKSAVAAWLQKRFASGDRIAQPRVLVKSWLSQPPNSPTVFAIEGARADPALGSATQPVTVRITPNANVSRIRMWQVWSSCSLSAVP
jgi:ketosteroid isomerase-like protein